MKTATNTLDIFATATKATKVNAGTTKMAKTVAAITTVKTEQAITMDVRAAEGKALLAEWKSKDKKAQKEFTQDISETGFDTRLGNLLNILISESPLKRENTISRQVLTANNLYDIHKGRRSSAIWFVQNKETAMNIINNATKLSGFSSIDAVYNKHLEIKKQLAADEAELNATDSDSDSDVEETETDDSVIGGVDMDTAETIEQIAADTLKKLQANDLQIADLFAAFTKLVAKSETIAVNKLAK